MQTQGKNQAKWMQISLTADKIASSVEKLLKELEILKDSQKPEKLSGLKNKAMCKPHETSSSNNNLDRIGQVNKGIYCWNDPSGRNEIKNVYYEGYFTDTSTCRHAIISKDLSCNDMALIFGVGSALVLTTTVIKVIYRHCKKRSSKKSTDRFDRAKRLASVTLQDGLLLGASSLGSSVILTSLLDSDPSGVLSEVNKKIIVSSTAFYWSSAASRLLGNCITSPIEEGQEAEEVVEVELPMLAVMDSKAIPPIDSGEGEKDGLTTEVIIVEGLPEKPSTSKSGC
ncbi:hypothetical protein [Candidatus Clavichlamydia salmonicola]|uniref:hypothetical protein n=1 Tax=Candidatus Clavichlamydia salmonicola TaxID=469812 RepID=UPI001891AE2B|nr:hypothetical protein [Candidatus Clavichlamydia salmonicola]